MKPCGHRGQRGAYGFVVASTNTASRRAYMGHMRATLGFSALQCLGSCGGEGVCSVCSNTGLMEDT